MLHQRYYITDLTISSLTQLNRVVDGRGGDLIVARKAESPALDWELVYRTDNATRIEQAPYRIEMDGPEGAMSGSAVLVRSDGISHVFRGAGDLDGFDESDFFGEL